MISYIDLIRIRSDPVPFMGLFWTRQLILIKL